ncbi:CRISPR-associated protein Cas4 [Ktedonobacter robiniae]|uniref:CRISPR-associated exonuclease Cas4 n=1 Tax=Ktedonobacter robiniae TaxID=2778365 RepID=A0ABQ3UP89_9CHLR|nr:CRISPR-associated protein Cas4 [Ktedonobacter robiniae]
MVGNILLPGGLGLLLFALALLLLWRNERVRQQERLHEEYKQALDLPGELVYEDADGQGETLYSSNYPLIGKPDYIVQHPDGRLIPIELKLTVSGVTQPDSNHVMQLIAYCLILEDYSEIPPTHGIVRYADRDFTIDYTPALRKKVIRLLSDMEQRGPQDPPPLKTQRASKCRACVFQQICPIGRDK